MTTQNNSKQLKKTITQRPLCETLRLCVRKNKSYCVRK